MLRTSDSKSASKFLIIMLEGIAICLLEWYFQTFSKSRIVRKFFVMLGRCGIDDRCLGTLVIVFSRLSMYDCV